MNARVRPAASPTPRAEDFGVKVSAWAAVIPDAGDDFTNFYSGRHASSRAWRL